MRLGRRVHRGNLATQEGIDASLAAQRGGQRDRVATAQDAHGLERLEHVGVAGLDGRGEAQVGERVLVGAEDAGVVGQRGEPLQGLVHLHGRALEQAAAPGAEQRVAAEQGAVAVVGDVSEGVPGHRHHDRVSVVEGPGGAGHALASRPEDLGTVPLHQRRDPANVVRMMMRDEDGSQLEPLAVQGFLDRAGIARIHDHRCRRLERSADQPEVVVRESPHRARFEHHRPPVAY